jgi:hypothetical protein
MKGYRVDCNKMYLSPGTSFSFKLQGPNNTLFKFSDVVSTTGHLNTIAKSSRFLFHRVVWDLAVTADDNATVKFARLNHIPKHISGSASTSTTNGLFGLPLKSPLGEELGFERTSYCSLSMPEEVGFALPAVFTAGKVVELGYRRPAYVYNVHSSGSFTPYSNLGGVQTAADNVEPTTGSNSYS